MECWIALDRVWGKMSKQSAKGQAVTIRPRRIARTYMTDWATVMTIHSMEKKT